MIVEVKPIDVKKWHGKEGKEAFGQPKTIEVLCDLTTSKYATGLNSNQVERLQNLTGYDLSDRFDPNKPHPFWSTAAARIKLPNHTILFDTTKPLDEIRVANLKASKFVANSYKEWQDGDFPEATHIIQSEEEEAEVKATKVEKKNKCIAITLGMSQDEKINLVQILSSKSVRGRSANFITVEIDKIIEDKPDEFLRYAKMDKQEVYTRAAVLEAVHRNILTKEGQAIYYMGDKLALDFEDAVTYFMNPQNQKLKVSILEKLNS